MAVPLRTDTPPPEQRFCDQTAAASAAASLSLSVVELPSPRGTPPTLLTGGPAYHTKTWEREERAVCEHTTGAVADREVQTTTQHTVLFVDEEQNNHECATERQREETLWGE